MSVFSQPDSAPEGFHPVPSNDAGFSQGGFSQGGFSENGFSQTGFRAENDGFSQGGFQPVPSHQNSTLPQKPKKRIIICCDGTWQSVAHGNQTIPSNIAKISRSIANYYVDENELMAPQIVYYDSGVGTGVGVIEKQRAGNFGLGLDENVCEAYNFIVNNYAPGDELFFFGFSRGAYTVRACAGLVCRVGICRPSAMNQFWEMYANYQKLAPETPFEKCAWAQYWDGEPETFTFEVDGREKTFSKGAGYDWFQRAEKNVTIKVVGVFDTVGSLGIPENVWFDVTGRNKGNHGFHNTDIHPREWLFSLPSLPLVPFQICQLTLVNVAEIENAFQALGLEEHRKPYRPCLWSLPPNSKTNLIQCWFPGVHVNIGGGSGDGLSKSHRGDLEMMSITTLMWMVDRCYPFLRFEMDPNIAIDYHNALTKTIEKALKATDAKSRSYGGWGVGPVLDLYNEGGNWVAGSEPRTPGHYFLNKEEAEGHKGHKHEHKQTNEYMHPVVQHAREQIDYNPEALQGFIRESLGPSKGFHWKKTYHPEQPGLLKRGWSYIRGIATPTDDGDDVVAIPEWVIPMEGMSEDGRYWQPLERWLVQHAANRVGGFITPEEREKREDIKVDQEGLQFLTKLDEENAQVPELHGWKKGMGANSNMKYPLMGF